MGAKELIAEWIEPDPHRPGADEVRLAHYGIAVWAVIGDFIGREASMDEEISQVAYDFEVPEEAVRAAVAYYRRHRAVIDNRLAANVAEA
ncbi:MAG: hypothetical protein HYX51_08015 [Chloroflexi bacterium]|nr:hypothetical protein [Chloroflexota bacterium]